MHTPSTDTKNRLTENQIALFDALLSLDPEGGQLDLINIEITDATATLTMQNPQTGAMFQHKITTTRLGD